MKYVIALDIGGTNLRAAIVNEDYDLVHVLIRDTVKGSLATFYQDIITIIFF